MSYFALDSLMESVLNSLDFAQFRFGQCLVSDKRAGKRTKAMACGTVNGKPMTTNKNEDHQRQEVEEQEATQQQAEALALKLAQTYEELTRLLERNPGMKREITEGEAKEDKVYQKLKQRLKMADMAPRCRWVRQDGTSCRSPQMKQHIYCFAHKQMAEARDLMLRLPPPEDANAIQVGLMRIQKALIEDTISTKKAGSAVVFHATGADERGPDDVWAGEG